jgi:homoserine dehydrogenase
VTPAPAGSAPIGVGLVGFGTIGTGVVKLLQRNYDVMRERLGFPLRMLRIADLDTVRDRGVDLSGIRFDADSDGLLEDPGVDIVVELIGG